MCYLFIFYRLVYLFNFFVDLFKMFQFNPLYLKKKTHTLFRFGIDVRKELLHGKSTKVNYVFASFPTHDTCITYLYNYIISIL